MEQRLIDHIVYCVPDLESGIAEIEHILGVRARIGGKHLTKGTKNALINLGNACYFEILAADHENFDFDGQRWMGIDTITTPGIMRWSLKSSDLEGDCNVIKSFSFDPGNIETGRRMTTSGKELSWRMTIPSASPEVDVLPFFTDWSTSEMHPTDTLEELCVLNNVVLYHPGNQTMEKVVRALDSKVEVKNASEPRIEITIQSPKGLIVIS